MKYFIFDFDGVLGDTFEEIAQARMELGLEDTIELARAGVREFANRRSKHTREASAEAVEKARQGIERFEQVMLKLKPKAFIGFVETSQAHIIGVVWTTQTDWPLVCRSGLANGPILVV